MADLSANIETNATGPKSVTSDGLTATQHDLSQQIEADKYLAQKVAGTRRKLPIRFAKLRPDGAA